MANIVFCIALGMLMQSNIGFADLEPVIIDPSVRVTAEVPSSPSNSSGIFMPLIVKGSNAAANEIPHGGVLTTNPASGSPILICGVVLLSRRVVLTAAKCVHDAQNRLYATTYFRVRLGEYDLARPENGIMQERLVSRIVVHNLYAPTNSWNNDMTLIQMATNVNLNVRVQPVNLWRQPGAGYINSPATISGWGMIDATNNKYTTILQKATTAFVNNNVCQTEATKSNLKVFANNLCIDGKLVSPCQGDVGGPVAVRTPFNDVRLVAIKSWGFSGCLGKPSIFMNTFPFLAWLDANLIALQ